MIFVRASEALRGECITDLGNIKKKGQKMADKTKEAAHKAEHRAEEAGEKAKDTVTRQI